MSPDNSILPPLTSIVDANGGIWTLDGINVLLNGVSASGGTGTKILLVNQNIYVFGVDNNWWLWNGTTWINVGTNQPTPPTVNLQAKFINLSELQANLDLYGNRIKFMMRLDGLVPVALEVGRILLIIDLP
mgnify:CR=1 FL=1